MKTYGYDRDGDEEANAPRELGEVSFRLTEEELDAVIAFLMHVRAAPMQRGKGESVHFHYRDWAKNWNQSESDVIVVLDY